MTIAANHCNGMSRLSIARLFEQQLCLFCTILSCVFVLSGRRDTIRTTFESTLYVTATSSVSDESQYTHNDLLPRRVLCVYMIRSNVRNRASAISASADSVASFIGAPFAPPNVSVAFTSCSSRWTSRGMSSSGRRPSAVAF